MIVPQMALQLELKLEHKLLPDTLGMQTTNRENTANSIDPQSKELSETIWEHPN